MHLFNPVIGSLQNLTDLIDAPVLGVVSSAFPDRRRQEARGEVYRFLGASAALSGVLVAVLSLAITGFRMNLIGVTGT
jgi:hypothetical protein